MAKILVLTHEKFSLEEDNSAPSTRLVNISKALVKKGHKVTFVPKNLDKSKKIDKIEYKKFSTEIINNAPENYDVVLISQWVTNIEILDKLDNKIPIMVDVYAPYMIEHSTHDYNKLLYPRQRYVNDIYSATLIAFRYGDYFLCASKRQRDYYLGILSAVGRVNPSNKRNNFGVVPYGVNLDRKKSDKNILRMKIDPDKKIILWLGTFYEWLDPIKTAKIFYEISKLDDKYVLAVVGAKNPNVNPRLYTEVYKEFVKYLKEKDLLDKKAFLFDWEERENLATIYEESEFLLLTNHKKSFETRLAFRTRFTDAMASNLPIITNGGDVISDEIKENKLGLIIEKESPKEVAKTILSINNKEFSQFRKNINNYIKKYDWDKIVEPIDEFCQSPFIDKTKEKFRYEKLIDSRRDRLIELIRTIEDKDKQIGALKQRIIDKDKLIAKRDEDFEQLIQQNKRLQEEIDRRTEAIYKYKNKADQFRNSITYPLYKITHTLGKTRIGHFLQRLLK